MKKVTIREKVDVRGQVRARHVAMRDGREIEINEENCPELYRNLRARGMRPEVMFRGRNLVVNTGRAQLARLIRRVTNGSWINRLQLGDTILAGSVRKADYPPDLSDTSLVHEIRDLLGNPGGTFDLDEDSSPDEVIKVDQSVGTPGTLTAGSISRLEDAGADFSAAGVDDKDTVTVQLSGEDYTFGVNEVESPTILQVSNPSQLAGAVGYTVQTPGTQALFSKRILGSNFPAAQFGPVTVVHEAGLLFTDGTLFNRITFHQNDPDQGLALQPTDIDGVSIDVQFDWLITF